VKVILFVSVILFSCNISAASLSTALTLNGLQWAQLTDTEYLYVPDVYAACGNSGGECSGTVGGKDLAGWRWASTDEVNVMFYELMSFNIKNPSGIPPDTSIWFDYFNINGIKSNVIFNIGLTADFVNYSETDGVAISGLLGSISINLNNDDGTGSIFRFDPFGLTYDQYGFEGPPYPYGFFMVKGDYALPSEVPIPASLFLFAPALIGLIGFRQKWFNTSLTR
tara:strand:- start:29855 stop:30526 length:672 start_codon:yes stop_codon:yes gene_type:complete